MSANAANRETVRDAIATGLGTALVGDGLPCAEVLNYDKGLIDLAPSLRVLSGGSARNQHGQGSENYRNKFRIVLRWYVPDASTDDSWTELNVEDTLDEIDRRVANWVMDNINTANWHRLMYPLEQMSTIAPAMPVKDAGGNVYMMEETVLIAEVYDA